MTDLLRHQTARRLFAEWTGVNNPDLLAGLWGNLCAADRKLWLRRADEFLEQEESDQ